MRRDRPASETHVVEGKQCRPVIRRQALPQFLMNLMTWDISSVSSIPHGVISTTLRGVQ